MCHGKQPAAEHMFPLGPLWKFFPSFCIVLSKKYTISILSISKNYILNLCCSTELQGAMSNRLYKESKDFPRKYSLIIQATFPSSNPHDWDGCLMSITLGVDSMPKWIKKEDSGHWTCQGLISQMLVCLTITSASVSQPILFPQTSTVLLPLLLGFYRPASLPSLSLNREGVKGARGWPSWISLQQYPWRAPAGCPLSNQVLIKISCGCPCEVPGTSEDILL